MPFNDNNNIFIFNEAHLVKEIIDFEDLKLGVFCLKKKSRIKEENEDCLFFSKLGDRFRFGVTDGAGGHPRGKDAAYIVSESLRVIDDDPILTKIELANQSVINLKAGAKTTLAFVEMDKNEVSFHSVGDSEIIYWNSVGREIYSSLPYSPAGLKVEAGVTTQAESLNDPERHLVMSLMGDDFIQMQSTSNLELKKGHTILVGSDGLFDNISHKQLKTLLSKGSFEDAFLNLATICEIQDEKTWLKEDDIAFVWVRKK